jgi:hypothetical protein
MSIVVSVINNVISVSLSNAGPQGIPGPGINAGGTSGQLLAKKSGSDYDTQWSSAGAVIGTLGGDLSGTLPNPTVTKTNGVALGTAAVKTASSNASATLASVPAPVAAGHVAVFCDNVGSLQDGGSLTPAALGAQPRYQLVGTRCGLNGLGGFFNSTAPGCESRIQHTLPYGAQSVYPLYAGFQMTLPGNVATESSLPLGAGYQAGSAVAVATGSGYAVSDTIVPTVAANQTAPTLVVTAISSGAIAGLAVADGGLFSAIPAAALTQTSTSGSGTGGTFTLGVSASVAGLHLGIEQAWGTQTAFGATALTGVRKLTKGATLSGAAGNVMLPSGDMVSPDAVLVTLPAGTTIGTRMWTPGWNIPVGRFLSGSAGLNEDSHSAVLSDTAWNGTYPAHTSPAAGFQPIAIMGRLATPKPSFVLIGDSIMYGVVSAHGAATAHDTLDANGNGGWAERAAAQQVPWSNFSTSTDQLGLWLNNSGSAMRMRALEMIKPSHALDGLAVNDFVGGAVSFATLQGYKIAFWKWLSAIGVKEIWAPTCTPYSSSTKGLAALPAIASGGAGYAASATFNVTIAGGTQSAGAAVVSVSTNGSGVVTTVNSIVNIGYYTVAPATTNSPTGGTGSGLSLTLTLDGWLDTASQTASAANTAIQAWNSWLRGGNAAAYGVTRILDLGTDVESSVGSGLWPAGASLDGLHQAAQFASATL